MPKTVYFIRHAKSSWDDITLRDHDRPLNKRGIRDAPSMADEMTKLSLPLDQIITSTAMRAKQTATFFQKQYEIPSTSFHEESNLYHGNLEDYLEGVRIWANDEYDTAALFAHNPGMTYLANNYSDKYIDNVPTCGIVAVEFAVDRFSEISKHNGRLLAFYYPKMFV